MKALSVLDHRFYNANDAMVVRSYLIDVVEKTNMRKLICACLELSTKISHNSLSHITAQIELLLKIFLHDTRQAIRFNALKNLLFLARKSPHIWESSHVEPMIAYLERIIIKGNLNNSDLTFVRFTLSLFCELLSCNCNFISQEEKDKIYLLCYKLTLNDCDLSLCPYAFELLTVKSEEALYSPTRLEFIQGDEKGDSTLRAIETFLALTSPKSTKIKTANQEQVNQTFQQLSTSANHNAHLKTVYRHIVKLCVLNPQYCSEILKLVFNKISVKDASLTDLCPYYTELICAISQYSKEYVITPDSCWKIINSKNSELSEVTLLNLSVLYFQALRLSSKHDVPSDFVERLLENRSSLFCYKVMRQAMRYGHFQIARLLCEQLHQHVTTDSFDFYVKSLIRICTAETTLSRSASFDKNLKEALLIYEESVSPLRASIEVSSTMNFQLQYLCLRVRTLQVHGNLRQCCKIYDLIPITCATLLNAIGAVRSGAAKTIDHSIAHLGSIQQMLRISKDFRHLAECYENLSATSSCGDKRTLDYLYLLKCSNIIMADAIDAVFQYGKNLHMINKLSLDSDKKMALEHRTLESVCNKLIDSIKYNITTPGIFPSEKTIHPFIEMFKEFSDEFLKCPFTYPRQFFQNSSSRSGPCDET